jgi:type II secretory pathway pseudopilin PulG
MLTVPAFWSSRRRSTPASSEAGESLVELMVTIAIMGTAMVAILGALWTTLRVADYNSKSSSADAALREFAEQLKQPNATDTFTYVPCTTAGAQVTYPTFDPPAPYEHYDATVTKVRYLTGYTAANEPVWANACPATDLGLQEITLKVTGPDNDPDIKSTDTVTIVKRDARDDVPVGSA